MTLPEPTCARMRAICSSAIDAADQLRSQPQISREEAREDLLAVGRVHDLGVKLDAVDAALHVLHRRHGRDGGGGQRGEPGRGLEDGVAVGHPAGLLARHPRQQHPGL